MRTTPPVLVIAALLGAGCTGPTTAADQPLRVTQLGPPAGQAPAIGERLNEAQVQALVMALADRWAGGIVDAALLLERDVGVGEERLWLHGKKYGAISAAMAIASGPNPDVALLNLLVLVRLERSNVERHWVPDIYGEERGRPFLERLRRFEDEVWNDAGRVLSEAQLAELADLVDRWLERNPDARVMSLVRFTDFLDAGGLAEGDRTRASGLFRQVSEATAAVDRMRLLGERSLWYTQRLAWIAGLQVEGTIYDLVSQPDIATSIAGADRLGAAVEDLAVELRRIPEMFRDEREEMALLVAAEREAAIRQLMDRVAAEREALLGGVESSHDELTSLATQVRATIEAGTVLATTLTATLEAAERTMAELRTLDDGATEADPFDPEGLRETTAEAGEAAEKLTGLLDSASALLASPDWGRTQTALSELEASGSRWMRRALLHGVVLIAAFFVMLLAYRWVAATLAPREN
ncbi:MAG: hypothetical protein ACYTG1_10480 [Planctomycetota bacterium]|jgi:hypothetical protein